MCEMQACYMCDNACTNPELDSDNDLSFFSIGTSIDGYRTFLRSGYGRPTVILFEKFGKETGWSGIAEYKPKYCPNCGRLLKENDTARK